MRILKARLIAGAILACALLVITSTEPAAFGSGSIPKPLKSRFVVGDPVWRELPVREQLQGSYEKCWQIAVSTILENNFDIATMDKDSGYIRTTWNEGVVVLGGSWYYKVQISVKFVVSSPEGENPTSKFMVTKARIQVTGELTNVSSKGIREFYRGYDQVILQNLFQDLQAKLGSV